MYTLNVVNNYPSPITARGGQVIPEHGGSAQFTKLGGMILSCMGLGELSFQDLGEIKIPGYPYPKQTWGVLIRYHSTEAYYRYEGGGEITATLDQFGTWSLSTSNGTMINVKLEELTVDPATN